MIRNSIYSLLTHHSGAKVLYVVEPLPLARSPDLHFAIPSLASLCTCVKIFYWISNFNLVQESTFGPVSSQSWTQVRASLVTTSSPSFSVMLEKMKPDEKGRGLCLRRSKLETKKHRVILWSRERNHFQRNRQKRVHPTPREGTWKAVVQGNLKISQ